MKEPKKAVENLLSSAHSMILSYCLIGLTSEELAHNKKGHTNLWNIGRLATAVSDAIDCIHELEQDLRKEAQKGKTTDEPETD